MNPGICYLYEYKNNQKLRNVGFMKVTPHYSSCILQINARGIPIQSGDSIKLSAFYEKDSEIIAKPIDEIPCEDKNIYARRTVSDSDFPDSKTLDDLGGFLLQNQNGQYYAATSDTLTFDTEKVKMWEEKPEPVMVAESLSATPCDIEDFPDFQTQHSDNMEEEVMPPPIPDQIADPMVTSDSETMDTANANPSPQTEYELPLEPPQQQMSDTNLAPPPEEQTQSAPDREQPATETVRKIHRSELSILPRRCWNLANNSFLLHGYHNYNHLLLVKENGHFWLGVPGVYAPREARAAELFGFPQFTQTYTSQLELDEEERDSSEKFGYWCRFIR